MFQALISGQFKPPSDDRSILAAEFPAGLSETNIRRLASAALNPRQREFCLEGLPRLGPDVLGG